MEEVASQAAEPSITDYAVLSVAQAALAGGLVAVVRAAPHGLVRPSALLGPVFAMFALTAFVWLLMVLYRNIAIMLGAASMRYYHAYVVSNQPAEWIERPARTFNNLMQVPVLFYVVCSCMLITGAVDRAQLSLAWLFVALRVLHALVYIAWNRVQYRFGVYFASCVTLGVIWTRFALASSALGLW